jgi:hypothetical protein
MVGGASLLGRDIESSLDWVVTARDRNSVFAERRCQDNIAIGLVAVFSDGMAGISGTRGGAVTKAR